MKAYTVLLEQGPTGSVLKRHTFECQSISPPDGQPVVDTQHFVECPLPFASQNYTIQVKLMENGSPIEPPYEPPSNIIIKTDDALGYVIISVLSSVLF